MNFPFGLIKYLSLTDCLSFILSFIQDEQVKGKRSILDMDPEVQAIIEMTGKTVHSQGLREPEEDQD